MSKGKPCQSDMSLREKQHMNLDTESTTYTGMDSQSKSCQKHLLLQVWCGLLTVSMVVMAAFLATKPRSTEDQVTTLKPDNANLTTYMPVSPSKLRESSLSYIQLIRSQKGGSWEESLRCQSCALSLYNNSIHCQEDGIYFIHALVTFAKNSKKDQTKHVTLIRNQRVGKQARKLVEGIFPNTTEASVWVAKIVRLLKGDSISLEILDNLNIDMDILKESTFWGAYQLH